MIKNNIEKLVETLDNILDLVAGFNIESYDDSKEHMIIYIDHSRNNLIDLILNEIDVLSDQEKNLIDVNNIKHRIEKANKNLFIIKTTVLDQIDLASFNDEMIYKFKQKLFSWIRYYRDDLLDLSKDISVLSDAPENDKVALCLIAKNENKYIREFVEYYKNIGFDNITIYDNNDSDGERVSDVIQDYISSGFVNVIDAHDELAFQLPCYYEFYYKNHYKYKWIAFFDADEFLVLHNHSNIHDYLNQDHFNDVDMIHINWMIYDDNDLVTYDDRPLMERFTRPSIKASTISTFGFSSNCHIKSIVRTRIDPANIKSDNPHTFRGNFKIADCNGRRVVNDFKICPPVYDSAQLNHYNTKTIDEFLTYKMPRNFADCIRRMTFDEYIDYFYKVNVETDAKNNFINNFRKMMENNLQDNL